MKIKNIPSCSLLLAALAMTACDEGALPDDTEAQSPVEAASAEQGVERRPEQALDAEIVEQDRSLWAAGSCAGACGGRSPDRSCWCDSGCSRFGDCCSDYRRECVEKDSENDSENDSSSSGPGTFSITGYSVSGNGCEGYAPSGEPREKTIITNSIPGGPKDYIQTAFDDFESRTPEGSARKRCKLTVYAKWTPGKRVIIGNAQQSGGVDLSASDWGRARFGTRIRFGYSSSADKSFSFSNRAEDSYDRKWYASSLGVYSNCSGYGSFTFDMSTQLSGSYSDEASASVDVFSAIFRLGKSYEVPGC